MRDRQRHDTGRSGPVGAAPLLVAGAAGIAFALQRGAHRRGYPAWDRCRCVFRTEPIVHIVLWGAHAPATDALLVLSVVRPPAVVRRALHHGAQWCAVLQDALRGGHAPYVVRVDVEGMTRTAEWLPLLGNGRVADPARPGLRRLLLGQRAAGDAILRVFREPRSGRLLLKNCCASRSPVGARVDCIGPALSQISYCTVRLPSPPNPLSWPREMGSR